MPERALTVTFLGNTAGLEAAMKRTTAQLNGMQTAGAGMQSLGRSMTRNLTVPIIGIGVAAATMAVKFQASMEQLHTQAGVSQSAIAGLSRGVLNMAGSVGASPEQLAKAMYHVASSLNATLPAATRSATELNVLKIAAEGAAVGHADLTDVTNALDAAVVSGIKGVQNFSGAMGGLNSIVGAGDMTMQNLADALSTGLLAPMKTYGLTLTDVGGALATFGDNNIRGQEAATKLISAVRIMAAPSKAAAKELGGLNLSTLQLANDMRQGGLVQALQDLKTHMTNAGLTASQQGLVIARAFGGRQSTGVQVLLSQLDRLQAKTKQVGDGANQFGQAWAATQQTAAFKIHAGLASMQADLTRFGDDVLPTLLQVGGTIVKDVDKVAHAFTSLPRGAQDAIIKGGLVLAAIGPAMKILGLFTGGIGKLWAITSKIQAWGTVSGSGAGAAGSLAAAERMSTVATMNVGSLIVRSMVGGAPGAGAYQPFGLGKPPATPATVPATVPAAVETSMASSLKSGLGTVLSGAMRGLMIGGIGTLAAQAIGASIHGAVGKAIGSIGTDAAIGAGIGSVFGPEGIIPGALVGGLLGAMKHFLGHDAVQEGRDFAKKFTAPLPGSVSNALKKALADAKTNELQTPPPTVPVLRRGRATRRNPAFEADTQAYLQAQTKLGETAGRNFVAGMQSVKFPSQWALLRDMGKSLEAPGLTEPARNAAGRLMIAYAEGLVKTGKLPGDQLDRIIASLEYKFHGLGPYLLSQGLNTAAVIAKTMKLDAAQKNWGAALEHFRRSWGDEAISLKITSANINSNTAQAMAFLTNIIRHGSHAQQVAAKREYDLLRTQTAVTFAALSADIKIKQATMTRSIVDGSGVAASTAVQNYNAFAAGVKNAMAAGAVSAERGAALINAAIESTVQAFKGKPIPAGSLFSGGSPLIFAQIGDTIAKALGVKSSGARSLGAHDLGAQIAAQTRAANKQIARGLDAANGTGSDASKRAAAAHEYLDPFTGKYALMTSKQARKLRDQYIQRYGHAPSTRSAAIIQASPAATPIPSQLVGAQTRMAELANQLAAAQNAVNTVAQKRALSAELKLEHTWLTADKTQLDKVNSALASGHVSLAKHKQLLQDKLAILQEIGNVISSIGSTQQSLSGLAAGAGAAGGFNLAPAGGQVKVPSIYDVRTAAGARHESHVTNHNTITLKIEKGADLAGVIDVLDRAVSGDVHARMRSAGMRGT